jgi:hypothetical protein
MGQDREQRIDTAIDSLISHIIPADPLEDEEVAQERHDACFELVKTILDRYVVCLGAFAFRMSSRTLLLTWRQ